MLGLNDSELITAASAIILPLIIAIVQRPTWSDQTRAIVGFVGVFLWTLVGVLFLSEGNPLTYAWQSWLRLFLGVFVTSYGAFLGVWKPSGVTGRIEVLTSPRSPARAQLKAETTRRSNPPRMPDAPLTPPGRQP